MVRLSTGWDTVSLNGSSSDNKLEATAKVRTRKPLWILIQSNPETYLYEINMTNLGEINIQGLADAIM